MWLTDADRRSSSQPERPRKPPSTEPPPGLRTPAGVVALQRSIGNRATQAVLARELNPDDQLEFGRRLRAQLGLGEAEPLPGPLAKMFDNACQRMATLEEVDEWLQSRRSLLAGYGKQSKAYAGSTSKEWQRARDAKSGREARQPSLSAWVAPESLAGAVQPYADMDGAWTEGDGNVPIVWTAGAASCVAVALYLPGQAVLCHLDPGRIGGPDDPLPNAFIKKLYDFRGGVMHVSSGQMIEFQQLLLRKIAALPGLAFASIHRHGSTRLALNARTGQISLAFNVDELMKVLARGEK